MGFAAWVAADRCTSGPQPGVQAFTRWVLEAYRRKGARNWGIYNCRNVAGTSTTSLHGEGRAVDVGFPVGDADGNRLLKSLLARPGRLGIQEIIYERKIYSAKSPNGRYYDGENPHNDHLHIGFSWEAAQHLTYRTVREVMAPPSRTPGERNLRRGTRGGDVRWLQQRLNLPVDGVFGKSTAERVLRFEESHPRKISAPDRVVNRQAWRALGVRPRY